MSKMNQFRYVELKNSTNYKNSIERQQFTCLELNIPNNGEWIRRVKSYAEQIAPKLNSGQANSSEKRNITTVEIDNLSGIIAESACKTILKWNFGDDKIIETSTSSSLNQIDIQLSTGKTIEVRSSCVRNGIEFAVFTKNPRNVTQQYFDVIGPYSNDYKPGERLKDYYMRVLYCCDKKNFMSLLEGPTLQLYITGGATKSMMCDTNIYQVKHLVPAGGQVQVESDYKVIPLGKSLDALTFFDTIASDNGYTMLHDI